MTEGCAQTGEVAGCEELAVSLDLHAGALVHSQELVPCFEEPAGHDKVAVGAGVTAPAERPAKIAVGVMERLVEVGKWHAGLPGYALCYLHERVARLGVVEGVGGDNAEGVSRRAGESLDDLAEVLLEVLGLAAEALVVAAELDDHHVGFAQEYIPLKPDEADLGAVAGAAGSDDLQLAMRVSGFEGALEEGWVPFCVRVLGPPARRQRVAEDDDPHRSRALHEALLETGGIRTRGDRGLGLLYEGKR